LDFYGGVFVPVWADNSNSTGDNPAGALATLDVYTARVSVSVSTASSASSDSPIAASLTGFATIGHRKADTTDVVA
jgi:hypothetical protein